MSTTKTTEQKLTKPKEGDSVTLIELAVLREKLDTIEVERKREREQFEDRIEQLQETLNKTQDNQAKTTLLLEHKTKEGRGGAEWEQAIKALEARISNQEETVNLEKEKAQKIEEEKKTLEEALELEKSKSFLHKILGK